MQRKGELNNINMKKLIVIQSLLTLAAAGALTFSAYTFKDEAIQIDVSNLLNTRPITTLTKGNFVTWTNGVDRENGYLTMSAAIHNGDKDPKALPDDPLIPADAHHPAILLHYANNDGNKYQARYPADTNSFTVKVPANNYKGLYVCLTSAYGNSKIAVDLIYKDGTEQKNFTVPDWYKDIPDTDPDFSYVVHNMAKWGKNKMTETDHHNIDALNIHPDAKRTLTAVKVKNLSKTYLVFWASTGVK